MDILLTHGYCLYEDPHELKVMKPYPPLGLLYNAAYLKRAGFDVRVFDTTFSRLAEFEAYLRRERPSVVGVYTNLMTKFNVLKLIAVCRQIGATVILGGPEPANYVAEYLEHGADVIVVGEGEGAMLDLLNCCEKDGFGRRDVPNVWFKGDGAPVTNPVRALIQDLDALPWADKAMFYEAVPAFEREFYVMSRRGCALGAQPSPAAAPFPGRQTRRACCPATKRHRLGREDRFPLSLCLYGGGSRVPLLDQNRPRPRSAS